MRDGTIKRRLANGEVVVGTMVFEFSTTGIGRLAAGAGAEFVIYDMEHTGWGSDTTRTLLASTPGSITPFVRVPAAALAYLAGQQLDLGASGVMAPMVETAEAAQTLAAATHYPPDGRRGAAFGIAHDDYVGGDIQAKVATANENVLTIAQIETASGVENVDAIAAVDGIDVLFLGHFDLTNFLGIPGRFDDGRFTDSVDRIVAAATEHGKALACLALTVEEAKRWIERGFRMITFGGDLWLYQKALAEGIRAIRG